MSILKTKRLILRPWKEADLAPFAALNADPKVMEYFPSILTKEQSEATLKSSQAHIEKYGWGKWAVTLIETGEFIGRIGLEELDFQANFSSNIELGYRLAFEHWGKGYASEGANAALKYGFNYLNLNEIIAFTPVQNMLSRAVMKRIGMHHDSKDDFDHPKLLEGHPLRRYVLYRISQKEWVAQQSDEGLTVRKCKTAEEIKAAIEFRQKHFFDERGIQDPYVWTFGHESHHHFTLKKGNNLIGYAHIQYWPNHRAALRIIVINQKQKRKGYGSYLMQYCEQVLKEEGIQTLHTEAHPTALKFYEHLGYSKMPFDDPEGHPSDKQDTPLGKKLL
ncbi:MAG: GNAT family N-acetyltransferase [Verrucomicrobia bacterium]|nr:GNAT family N-acetyltransferase [Verrucomicrobiota bacterium]MBS0645880.1 GNAT family N-acetyltransferase [Verrucomicrobiota bacterium]